MLNSSFMPTLRNNPIKHILHLCKLILLIRSVFHQKPKRLVKSRIRFFYWQLSKICDIYRRAELQGFDLIKQRSWLQFKDCILHFIEYAKRWLTKVWEGIHRSFTFHGDEYWAEMKAIVKDYNLTVDYCAFMLAIVIVCHSVHAVNTNYQWSAEEISQILNELPRAKHPNFHVNPVALKQGLILFKRHLHKWGISTIEGRILRLRLGIWF